MIAEKLRRTTSVLAFFLNPRKPGNIIELETACLHL